MTLTGLWAVSLFFFRIPRATKKSSSTSYFTPSTVFLAELPESSGCHCVLAARWKVFPSPSSHSLGNPCQAVLPRNEGLGSPSDGAWGEHPWILHAAHCFGGSWQTWRLGKCELRCKKPLGSAARLNNRDTVSLLVF